MIKVHFTVTGGNKAGVDLVLIVKTTVTKHVAVTQTTVNFYSIIFIRKRRRFVSKQGQPQPHPRNHSTTRTLSLQL